jgi:voltage-gated potassium channel
MFVFIIVAGTLGLMVTGDRDVFHALYMTMVILTTVGMEGPTNEADRVWSLVLMICGIGAILYASGYMVSFVVEGQLKQLIGRHKVTEHIHKLNGHYIVVGYGRMGHALCATLAYRDLPLVLIENSPRSLRDAEENGILCIEGNAMHDAILEEAGISRARGLVTCLSDDADNVLVTLTARGMNPDLIITSRCDEIETEPKLHRAGANRVICPAVMGAARASHQMLNPRVDDMIELDGHWPDLELSRISLDHFPGFTQRTLSDVYHLIGEQTIVVALIQGDGTRILRPSADTAVNPRDQLVVIGGTGSVNYMVDALNHVKAA